METEVLEKLREKAGGDFKLVSLFDSRLRDFMRGLPPLIEQPPREPWDVVTQEILREKIALVTGEAAERMRKELADAEAAEELVAPASAPARKRRHNAKAEAA
jgi:hypothetical protein